MSKLSFGKFKGEDIEDVDLSYLKWLEEQNWIDSKLRDEINHVINQHEGDRPGKGYVRPKFDKIT